MIVADNYESLEAARSNCIYFRRSQKGIAELKQALAEFNGQYSYWDWLHEDDVLEFETARFNPSMKAAAESNLTRGNED
ncbi:MAG: hypothetical protein WA395_04220 [Nitrososphaeraceae archaeon]